MTGKYRSQDSAKAGARAKGNALPEGHAQVLDTIAYYKRNARVMMDAFDEMGVWYTGGVNSPYLWIKCPEGMNSWDYFDYLLENAEIVGTPGAGFGKNGEGYFRLTAFGDADKTVEAMERLILSLKCSLHRPCGMIAAQKCSTTRQPV